MACQCRCSLPTLSDQDNLPARGTGTARATQLRPKSPSGHVTAVWPQASCSDSLTLFTHPKSRSGYCSSFLLGSQIYQAGKGLERSLALRVNAGLEGEGHVDRPSVQRAWLLLPVRGWPQAHKGSNRTQKRAPGVWHRLAGAMQQGGESPGVRSHRGTPVGREPLALHSLTHLFIRDPYYTSVISWVPERLLPHGASVPEVRDRL